MALAAGIVDSRHVNATQLCTVAHLEITDILQVGNDPAFYGIVSIERSSPSPDATWRVRLRELAGARPLLLVRDGREHLLIVPRRA